MSSPVEQLSCQEFVELATDYLEDALSPGDRARFEEHLGICDGCNSYLEQMEATLRVTGRLRPEDLDADAKQTLLAAFRDWKRSDSPSSL